MFSNKHFYHGMDFIIPHNFVDFCDPSTFYDRFEADNPIHVDMTNPFSSTIRRYLIKTLEELTEIYGELEYPFHGKSVYWRTYGNRFETDCEIELLSRLGADIVGMTNPPEATLAREVGIEYATIAIGTNYAAGISDNELGYDEVEKIMRKRRKQLNQILIRTVAKLYEK
jgi:5'-methylthioadenosine phosphorylase